MTHLGERVSALVDGQLPLEAVERANAHLAHCRDCRDAVEAERLMKARLKCLPDPEPAPDLLGRLLALGGPAGPLPPRPGHVPGSPRPATLAVWDTSGEPAVAAVSGAPVPEVSVAEVPATEVPVPVSPTPVPAGVGAALPVTAAPVSASLLPGSPARTAARPPASRGSSRPAGRPATGSRNPRPRSVRPTGRPVLLTTQGAVRRRLRLTRARARLAGAIIGALGVLGAGVSGLVLLSPGAASAPAKVPLDSFVVSRPVVVTPSVDLVPRTLPAGFPASTPLATGSASASTPSSPTLPSGSAAPHGAR